MGGITFPFGSGTILTVSDGADIVTTGAEADEVLANGIGPFLAEGEIVLWGTPSIGVACDDNFGVSIIAEVVGKLIEFGAFFGFDGEAVVGKENGIGFEGFVVGGIGVTRALGKGLIVDIIGAVTESGAVTFFTVVGASGKDGEEGEK